jgi:hypothetical protein
MSVQSKLITAALDPDFRRKAKIVGITLGSLVVGLSIVNRLQNGKRFF